jgi:hypothetical protein
MVGRRVVLWLVAAGGVERRMPEARDVEPGAGASSIETRQHHDALDAVAGSEYLDDRIRLGE